MAETEGLEDSGHPTPRFELEHSADYSQFLLHSPSEILAVLRSLIQKGSLITVYFDQGRSFLLTSMLALSADNRELILDIGSNAEMNSKALLAGKLIFTALIDKVKVQFSLSSLSATQSEGRPAFLAAVPETLLRLQRREFFRLATPLARPVTLSTTVRRADDSALIIEVPLMDVSGGGVGLMVSPEQAELFQRGDTLHNCKIVLPDEGLLSATLCVRNMFDVTMRSGSRHVRVGCEFVDLPAQRLTMVQRYIIRVERERKARLSGLA